jgi:MoaA/NifB/PqqE/SkfB family radical SAM enzyme
MEITLVPELLGLDTVEKELMLGLLQVREEPFERLTSVARLEPALAQLALDGLLRKGVAVESQGHTPARYRLADLEADSRLGRQLEESSSGQRDRLHLELDLMRELRALGQQQFINVISIKGRAHDPEPAPAIRDYLRGLFPYLDLRLGTRCNFNCRYCLVGSEKKFVRPMDEVIGELEFGRRCGLLRVALTGGEPMLYPGLLDVVTRARSLGYEQVILVTNASLLATESNLDRLLEAGVSAVGFSFDVPSRELSEHLWRSDAFEVVTSGIQNLMARSEIILGSIAVITEQTYRELPELARFLADQAERHQGLFLPNLDFVMPEENAWTHRTGLVPRLTEVAPWVRGALRVARDRGLSLTYRGIPACVLGSDWLDLDMDRFMHIFQVHDTGGEVAFNRAALDLFRLKPATCRRCRHHRHCSGVFRAYAHLYGTGELVPIPRGQS